MRTLLLLATASACLGWPSFAQADKAAGCHVMEAALAESLTDLPDFTLSIVEPPALPGAQVESTLREAKDVGFLPAELEALERRLLAPPAPDPRRCVWKPFTVLDARWRVTVAQPVFATPDLAFVQFRVDERDRGRASACAVRRTGESWRATCRQMMIWAR